MKILITTDSVGGVWHYAIDLASTLLEEQIGVVLVAMGPSPNTAQLSQIEKFKTMGLVFYHQPYRLEWMDDPWEDVAEAGEWIKQIYREEKPDLMHFNNYAHVGLGWDVPTVLVAHSCIASWWHSVKNEPLPDRYHRYVEIVQNSFHSADVVVSPSRAMLEIYYNLYGEINNPHVIYNGLPDTLAGFSSKMPIIFSMGRLWDEAKNIHLLLEAAQNIEGDIYIAGQKPKSLSSPQNVKFLGLLSRQQIFNWLKISSLYVLPVKYEPFGLSFLEAASHKCALIGGDIPTLREIWGESMTYIDPEDSRNLAMTCNELLMQEALCKFKGEQAYHRAKNYTIMKMKDEYLGIYNEMLNPLPEALTGNL